MCPVKISKKKQLFIGSTGKNVMNNHQNRGHCTILKKNLDQVCCENRRKWRLSDVAAKPFLELKNNLFDYEKNSIAGRLVYPTADFRLQPGPWHRF